MATVLAGCSVLTTNEATAPFHEGNWYSYGNSPTNTNQVAGDVPEPEDHTRLASAQWPYTPPVIHDNVAYVAADRAVTAVTIDGTEQWSQQLDTEVSGAPALDPKRGRLYVPTRTIQRTNSPDSVPATVTILSLTDGAVLNSIRVGNGRTYGVTIAGGDVYVRSASACVRFAPDGTERWRQSFKPLVYDGYNLGDDTATQISPAVGDEGVYVPDLHALVKLDPTTGRERWRVPVDTAYAASVVTDSIVVQTGWQETVAVDHSGDIRWRRDLHSRAAAAVRDGDVYVIAGDLHEVDAATGETNWQTHLSSEGTAAPLVTSTDVIAVTSSVHAFRRDTDTFFGSDRECWQSNSVHATAFSSPVIAAGRLFVAGHSGLVAFRPGADT